MTSIMDSRAGAGAAGEPAVAYAPAHPDVAYGDRAAGSWPDAGRPASGWPDVGRAGTGWAGPGWPAPGWPGAVQSGSAVQPPPYPYLEPKQDRLTAFVTRLLQRAPRWTGPAAAATAIGGAIAYTFLVVHPHPAGPAGPSTCLLRMLTGFDCPGCGGTRAAWFLMHGDLPAAVRHHAPFAFAVPFLLYLFIAWSLRTAFGWRIPQLRISSRAIVVFMAVWGVFSVARNLPWAPFTWFYV